MSFWDNVKKFTQPYADDEYDDYDDEDQEDYEEEPEESAPRQSRRAPAFSQAAAQQDPVSDFSAPPTVSTASSAVSGSSSLGSSGFSGQVLSMGSSGSKQEVVLFHAKAFDDAARAADDLRSRKAIILNMENVDKALTRRVVDFLSGCVYAVDGKVKKIAQSTYLFCPHSMDIVGDLEAFQGEVESYI